MRAGCIVPITIACASQAARISLTSLVRWTACRRAGLGGVTPVVEAAVDDGATGRVSLVDAACKHLESEGTARPLLLLWRRWGADEAHSGSGGKKASPDAAVVRSTGSWQGAAWTEVPAEAPDPPACTATTGLWGRCSTRGQTPSWLGAEEDRLDIGSMVIFVNLSFPRFKILSRRASAALRALSLSMLSQGTQGAQAKAHKTHLLLQPRLQPVIQKLLSFTIFSSSFSSKAKAVSCKLRAGID